MYFPLFFLTILIWAKSISANTETIVFRVPKYYEVPFCPRKFESSAMSQVNASTYVVSEFPIQNLQNYTTEGSSITVPSDYDTKEDVTVFVKLNNYGNSAFDSNDLINVKLCWPATIPISFDLEQVYVKSSELGLSDTTLDIFVRIQLHGDFYAVRDVLSDTVEFDLVITKLPWGLPVPVELYSFIMYVADLLIVLYGVFPYVVSGFECLAASAEPKEHED